MFYLSGVAYIAGVIAAHWHLVTILLYYTILSASVSKDMKMQMFKPFSPPDLFNCYVIVIVNFYMVMFFSASDCQIHTIQNKMNCTYVRHHMLLHDSNYMFNKYKENSKLLKYLYLLWKKYGSDSQCIEDVLSDLLSSDAVDDRVETAWKEQVQYAEENPNGCRETVSYSIWEESCEYDGQTNSHDHDVRYTGVKSFGTWLSWAQHRAEYDCKRQWWGRSQSQGQRRLRSTPPGC